MVTDCLDEVRMSVVLTSHSGKQKSEKMTNEEKLSWQLCALSAIYWALPAAAELLSSHLSGGVERGGREVELSI